MLCKPCIIFLFVFVDVYWVCRLYIQSVVLIADGNSRSYALNNLQILPRAFYLNIYDIFLPPDTKGLNI